MFCILAMVMLGVACGSKLAEDDAISEIETETAVNLEDDLQGFWQQEDSGLLLGFKGDVYILYSTKFCLTGTFDVDGDFLTMTPDSDYEAVGEKVYEATIKDGVLYLYIDGKTTRWTSISEEAVRRIYLDE